VLLQDYNVGSHIDVTYGLFWVYVHDSAFRNESHNFGRNRSDSDVGYIALFLQVAPFRRNLLFSP